MAGFKSAEQDVLSRPEGRRCNGAGNASADLRISACTGIIESSRDVSVKALAFLARGTLYTEKKEYDLAIADLDQSIKINPNCTVSFGLRGAAYALKAQYDRAVVDLDEAYPTLPRFGRAFLCKGCFFLLWVNTTEPLQTSIKCYDSCQVTPRRSHYGTKLSSIWHKVVYQINRDSAQCNALWLGHRANLATTRRHWVAS